MAHINGMESFWALLKLGYYGTYHQMSPEHPQRYVDEFVGRHNIHRLDTVEQMEQIAKGLFGKLSRTRCLPGTLGKLHGREDLENSYSLQDFVYLLEEAIKDRPKTNYDPVQIPRDVIDGPSREESDSKNDK